MKVFYSILLSLLWFQGVTQNIDTAFWPNQKIKSIKTDKENGLWYSLVTFYENGNKESEGQARNNKIFGDWTNYYSDGTIKSTLACTLPFWNNNSEPIIDENCYCKNFDKKGLNTSAGLLIKGIKEGDWYIYESGVKIEHFVYEKNKIIKHGAVKNGKWQYRDEYGSRIDSLDFDDTTYYQNKNIKSIKIHDTIEGNYSWMIFDEGKNLLDSILFKNGIIIYRNPKYRPLIVLPPKIIEESYSIHNSKLLVTYYNPLTFTSFGSLQKSDTSFISILELVHNKPILSDAKIPFDLTQHDFDVSEDARYLAIDDEKKIIIYDNFIKESLINIDIKESNDYEFGFSPNSKLLWLHLMDKAEFNIYNTETFELKTKFSNTTFLDSAFHKEKFDAYSSIKFFYALLNDTALFQIIGHKNEKFLLITNINNVNERKLLKLDSDSLSIEYIINDHVYAVNNAKNFNYLKIFNLSNGVLVNSISKNELSKKTGFKKMLFNPNLVSSNGNQFLIQDDSKKKYYEVINKFGKKYYVNAIDRELCAVTFSNRNLLFTKVPSYQSRLILSNIYNTDYNFNFKLIYPENNNFFIKYEYFFEEKFIKTYSIMRIIKLNLTNKFNLEYDELDHYSFKLSPSRINKNQIQFKSSPEKGSGDIVSYGNQWNPDTLNSVFKSKIHNLDLATGKLTTIKSFPKFNQFLKHEPSSFFDLFWKDTLDSKKTIVKLNNGTLKFCSKEKENEVLLNVFNNDAMILYTEDGYYLNSKNAGDFINFNYRMRSFSFEQFDLKYNRPDIVLERLGYADSATIETYHKAYLKRLKKMGFTEDMLKEDFHLPEINIKNFEYLPSILDSSGMELDLDMNDTKYKLDRINIFINDVPIYGSNGINLRNENSQSLHKNISIQLSEGQNKIQVSVLNQAGAESYKETVYVTYKPKESKKPHLYLVTIGDSKYKDARYDLTYAAKDAEDIKKTFEGNSSYSNVFAYSFTNERVTRENILALKKELLKAKRDDVVIITVAGHGVLDKNLDYYLATYDMDFNNPSGKGIPYEELESLVDGIAPLKKVLFLDACHSGEVDKDEVEQLAMQTTNTGDVKFRAAGAGIQKKNLGLKTTSELMGELFTDLRRGTGATVISSAGGAEYAMESDQWKNGLFTYCLLHGLKDKAADTNGDGQIMLSELQQYLRTEVTKLSNGAQQPTSRIENLSMDFRVW